MKFNIDIFKKIAPAIKKKSPEILIGAGIAGTITSTVLACRATLKVTEVLDEAKETIDTIHETENNEEFAEKYTKEDAKKDLTIVYVQTGLKIAALYAPAVILGGLSIASIFTSNNILRKRCASLAAAYTTIDQSFKQYRKNVVDRFGEEVDKELRYNIKKEKATVKEVDENGNVKETKKTVSIANIEGFSDYAVYFDSSSPYYEGNRDYDMYFLRSQQNYANDTLRVKGYLTLNEVFENLRIPVSDELRKAGMVVGWKYEKDNPDGDNRVDFNILETYRKREDGEVEPAIILDFNVDGEIYSRM